MSGFVVTVYGDGRTAPEEYDSYGAAMDRAIGLWQDGRRARVLDSEGGVVWDSKDAALWQIVGPLMVVMDVGRVNALCLALRAMDVPASNAVGIVEGMTGKRMDVDEFNGRVRKAEKKLHQ